LARTALTACSSAPAGAPACVHLPAQLVKRPRWPAERDDRPADQHEGVLLYREAAVEQGLAPAGERGLEVPREAADAYPQRIGETRKQRPVHPRQVHLEGLVLVRQVVLVDDRPGEGTGEGNAVERDQGGVDLVQGVRQEVDVFRYRGLHLDQEIAQRPGLGPVAGHGRDKTVRHKRQLDGGSR
jgi:hypothetical protein